MTLWLQPGNVPVNHVYHSQTNTSKQTLTKTKNFIDETPIYTQIISYSGIARKCDLYHSQTFRATETPTTNIIAVNFNRVQITRLPADL